MLRPSSDETPRRLLPACQRLLHGSFGLGTRALGSLCVLPGDRVVFEQVRRAVEVRLRLAERSLGLRQRRVGRQISADVAASASGLTSVNSG